MGLLGGSRTLQQLHKLVLLTVDLKLQGDTCVIVFPRV